MSKAILLVMQRARWEKEGRASRPIVETSCAVCESPCVREAETEQRDTVPVCLGCASLISLALDGLIVGCVAGSLRDLVTGP